MPCAPTRSAATDELRIPRLCPIRDPAPQDDADTDQAPGPPAQRDGSVHGGGVGMAWTGDSGCAGLSYGGYDSDYGSVAEDTVRLKMRQERFGATGKIEDLDGPFKSLEVRLRLHRLQASRKWTMASRAPSSRITATKRGSRRSTAILGPLRGTLGSCRSARRDFPRWATKPGADDEYGFVRPV